MIIEIKDKAGFDQALENAGNKLVVVDFTATWCGPCQMIKPIFAAMSDEYTSVVFLKVDVDEAQEVASSCDIKCMPTFQFYKNGKKIHEFSGANKDTLQNKILQLQ
ncbi:thioredoxin b [Misgurnus anguillicaudatus]|uniref:thioredoxin b n=1 Tax=Misgurnus anguillicaudatus TaxID=75329 RepID=UPI003CCFC5EC